MVTVLIMTNFQSIMCNFTDEKFYFGAFILEESRRPNRKRFDSRTHFTPAHPKLYSPVPNKNSYHFHFIGSMWLLFWNTMKLIIIYILSINNRSLTELLKAIYSIYPQQYKHIFTLLGSYYLFSLHCNRVTYISCIVPMGTRPVTMAVSVPSPTRSAVPLFVV